MPFFLISLDKTQNPNVRVFAISKTSLIQDNTVVDEPARQNGRSGQDKLPPPKLLSVCQTALKREQRQVSATSCHLGHLLWRRSRDHSETTDWQTPPG